MKLKQETQNLEIAYNRLLQQAIRQYRVRERGQRAMHTRGRRTLVEGSVPSVDWHPLSSFPTAYS